MAAFDYKAVDKLGREQRGLLEGDTPRQVRQLLRERGLLPVTVTEVASCRVTSARTAPPARAE